MNPHTPYILVAYAAASVILLFTAIAPILAGSKLRKQITKLAKVASHHDTNSG